MSLLSTLSCKGPQIEIYFCYVSKLTRRSRLSVCVRRKGNQQTSFEPRSILLSGFESPGTDRNVSVEANQRDHTHFEQETLRRKAHAECHHFYNVIRS